MAKTKTYPGALEQRGPSWRWIFYIGGKRHAVTLTAVDREDAAEQAAKRYPAEVQAAGLEQAGIRVPRTLPELAGAFEKTELPALAASTRAGYTEAFGRFRAFFGKPAVPLRAIGRGHIKRYLAWRAAQKRNRGTGRVSARTVALDRAILCRLLAYAVEMEFLPFNPVLAVKAPKGDPFEPVILDGVKDERTGEITVPQYEALLAACEERPMLRLYVLLLGETGMRARSEALRLRWADVDLAGGFIHIRGRTGGRKDGRTKSGKGRYVPMSPRLADAMREHFAAYRFAEYDGVRPEYIFHHTKTRRRGKRVSKAGARLDDLRAAFTNAVERAGLPEGFRRHDLRHLRVTTWLAEGKSPVLVQHAVGHADQATTQRYTHLVKEHLRALVEPSASPPPRGRQAKADE